MMHQVGGIHGQPGVVSRVENEWDSSESGREEDKSTWRVGGGTGSARRNPREGSEKTVGGWVESEEYRGEQRYPV